MTVIIIMIVGLVLFAIIASKIEDFKTGRKLRKERREEQERYDRGEK